MADITLNTMIYAGLLFAFVIPALAAIGTTLAPPVPLGPSTNVSINYTLLFNARAAYLSSNFNGTEQALYKQMIGTPQNNYTGSFAAPVAQIQAYAFIISGLGTIMLDLVQLPQLDIASMNFIVTGMATILPGASLGFLLVGVNLLYLYLIFSMLMVGFSLLSKYNIRDG